MNHGDIVLHYISLIPAVDAVYAHRKTVADLAQLKTEHPSCWRKLMTSFQRWVQCEQSSRAVAEHLERFYIPGRRRVFLITPTVPAGDQETCNHLKLYVSLVVLEDGRKRLYIDRLQDWNNVGETLADFFSALIMRDLRLYDSYGPLDQIEGISRERMGPVRPSIFPNTSYSGITAIRIETRGDVRAVHPSNIRPKVYGVGHPFCCVV